ncbi:hypothetical protein LTR37_016500 [Vermiconidia calcicola]|uniref:Uncharacterized protein n=1 Tax=Vermiconidia calcicola TaxID=1690605 RepID=A0ACC3MNF7_9PEZI|nr:hypothetical protein LTR37_016500 [Vermiconidia calcicola]
MTKTRYALAYGECTDAELRSFIKSRGLHFHFKSSQDLDSRGLEFHIKRSQNRKAAIRSLRHADAQANLQFFDLPPEMRN